MPVYQLGGKSVVVSTWSTSWPVSVFYKQQGIEVQINPHRNWWCLWICTSTDPIDGISATIDLTGLDGTTPAAGSCKSCGDLVVKGPGFWGFSAPWPYGAVGYLGSVTVNGQTSEFQGSMAFS